MKKINQILGMAWATPVVRTAVQAGLAVVVASGLDFVDVEVWKTAVLSAGAAGLAALQAASRG